MPETGTMQLSSLATPHLRAGPAPSMYKETAVFPVPAIKTSSIELGDVVDLKILQRIQDTFSKAMGVAAVTVNRQGIPVTRDSNFRRICRMIRSTEKGLRRCMQCDAEGGLTARSRGEPYVYICKGGMLDIAAPITIQGEYIGSVLCGQVIPAAEHEEGLERVISWNSELNLSIDDVKKAALEIPTIPRERVDAAGEMLFQMANYIVEMGVANLSQNKLLEEINARMALQSALRDAQLNMLQSQITPHFLFNALGLISYTALQENARQTEEITYSLSDLLRYSLRSSVTAPVTLGQEIEVIEHYLSIQKLRFRSRLQVEMNIDPSVREVAIPCMILQPLVENAVIHAVEPLARPVKVIVNASRQTHGVFMEVLDTGVGMDALQLASLRAAIANPANEKHSIGLRNVIYRLELQYGDQYQMDISSELGHGTRIALLLPIGKPGSTGP